MEDSCAPKARHNSSFQSKDSIDYILGVICLLEALQGDTYMNPPPRTTLDTNYLRCHSGKIRMTIRCHHCSSWNLGPLLAHIHGLNSREGGRMWSRERTDAVVWSSYCKLSCCRKKIPFLYLSLQSEMCICYRLNCSSSTLFKSSTLTIVFLPNLRVFREKGEIFTFSL